MQTGDLRYKIIVDWCDAASELYSSIGYIFIHLDVGFEAAVSDHLWSKQLLPFGFAR